MQNLGGYSTPPTARWNALDITYANGTALGGTGATCPPRNGAIALTNATAAQQPLFQADCGDGMPGILFDGSDDRLFAVGQLSVGSWADAFALYVVAKSTRPDTFTAQAVAGLNVDTVTCLGLAAGFQDMLASLNGVGNTTSLPADNVTTPGSKPNCGHMILWMSWDGATFRRGCNQMYRESAPGSVDFAPGGNNLIVGRSTVAGGATWYGPIRDVALYNAAHTLADSQAIINDLSGQWGGINSAPEIYYFGDSQTTQNGWPQMSSGRGSIRAGWQRNYAVGGADITGVDAGDLDWQITQALAAISSARQRRIAVMFIGTNEYRTSASGTAGATAYAALKARATTLKNNGFLVIGATTTTSTFAGTNAAFESTNRPAFNAALKADAKSINGVVHTGAFWDAVIDWDVDSRLADSANVTYRTDGLHYTTAGHAVQAELAEPVISAVMSVIGIGRTSLGAG